MVLETPILVIEEPLQTEEVDQNAKAIVIANPIENKIMEDLARVDYRLISSNKSPQKTLALISYSA